MINTGICGAALGIHAAANDSPSSLTTTTFIGAPNEYTKVAPENSTPTPPDQVSDDEELCTEALESSLAPRPASVAAEVAMERPGLETATVVGVPSLATQQVL